MPSGCWWGDEVPIEKRTKPSNGAGYTLAKKQQIPSALGMARTGTHEHSRFSLALAGTGLNSAALV